MFWACVLVSMCVYVCVPHIQIGEYWVPKGTPVWIPLYPMSNTSANFPRYTRTHRHTGTHTRARVCLHTRFAHNSSLHTHTHTHTHTDKHTIAHALPMAHLLTVSKLLRVCVCVCVCVCRSPNKFIPERWSDSANTAGRTNTDKQAPNGKTPMESESGSFVSRHDWMSLAFSQGTRSCPGLNQALMQVGCTHTDTYTHTQRVKLHLYTSAYALMHGQANTHARCLRVCVFSAVARSCTCR